MKIAAIIEARMTSSRLPGKVLKTVMGKPMLEYLIERLKLVDSLDEIIIATTTNTEDDKIQKFAEEKNILVHRGSEFNVMKRVLEGAKKYKVDIVVKITGDCPIIDPNIVEQCIRIFEKNSIDFLSNGHFRSYPDGMDVAVFTYEALEKSFSLTHDKLDLEHVTLHMRNNPEIFRSIYLLAPPNLHWPELGLTLDEIGDYELIKKIIEHFGKDCIFSCEKVINYLKKEPDLLSLNEYVDRKGDN